MIAPDRAAKIYAAIDVIRNELPLVAAVIEIIDPASTPFVEGGEFLLSKIFEAISSLEKHANPEDLIASARASTAAKLQDIIDSRQATDAAMQKIRDQLALP